MWTLLWVNFFHPHSNPVTWDMPSLEDHSDFNFDRFFMVVDWVHSLDRTEVELFISTRLISLDNFYHGVSIVLCGRDGYNVTKVLWSHGTIFVHMVHGRSKCHYVSQDCCMTLPPTIKTQKTWSDLTLAPQLVLVGMECELGCCFLLSMLVTLMACVPWFQKWIPHLPYIFSPAQWLVLGQ